MALLFYLLAVISFAVAAVAGEKVTGRVNLIALGLAFFVVGHIV